MNEVIAIVKMMVSIAFRLKERFQLQERLGGALRQARQVSIAFRLKERFQLNARGEPCAA